MKPAVTAGSGRFAHDAHLDVIRGCGRRVEKRSVSSRPADRFPEVFG